MRPHPDCAEDLAEAVAAAAVSVPGVNALHAGRFGEVATYLPGRRVVGVRVDDDTLDVHIVMRWEHDVAVVAAAVHQAVAAVAPGRQVSVTVEDVGIPDHWSGGAAGDGPA